MRERSKDNVLPFRRAETAVRKDLGDQFEQKLFGTTLNVLERRFSHSSHLTQTLTIIQKHFDDHTLDLNFVSAACGVEKNHLNTLLRASCEVTFHQLLIRYRVLQAARLLRGQGGTVLEVAELSGFRSVRTFNRNFTRLIGCSPCRFRKPLSWKSGKRSKNSPSGDKS